MKFSWSTFSTCSNTGRLGTLKTCPTSFIHSLGESGDVEVTTQAARRESGNPSADDFEIEFDETAVPPD